MKAIFLAAALVLILLASSREASACQFCKLESDGWHCVPCLPLFVYGRPDSCKAKCEKAETPKEAEACLNKECPKP
jgi:hypothetical protein